MKCCITEILIIFLLCFVELFKVVSSSQRPKSVDIIDNFIGLAEPNNNEIEKRNSIVDGGVFVPYKSTTIVYKSRLVPVTYGFVIKKETLKDNPALYKLGVKLLDEKVEQIPKQLLDGKSVESVPAMLNQNDPKSNDHQQLDAKSNCVKGSKVLRLLAKLSRDINKIEKAIIAQNQSVESEQEKFIAKSPKTKKLHPQNEAHMTGHKGVFENDLNRKKSQKHHISKNLSRYWQCRRSHTKMKCAVLLLMKHAHDGRHNRKHSARHETAHHSKHLKKHPAKHQDHETRYLNKHNDESTNKHERHENLDKYKQESPVRHHSRETKQPGKLHRHQTKNLNRHGNHEAQQLKKHNNDRTMHRARHEPHRNHHRKHPAKLIKSREGQHLEKYNNDNKRQPIRYSRRRKKSKKKKKQG